MTGAARFRTRATPVALRKQARERHERMLRDTVRLLINFHDQGAIDHARAVLAATTQHQRDMIGENPAPRYPQNEAKSQQPKQRRAR